MRNGLPSLLKRTCLPAASAGEAKAVEAKLEEGRETRSDKQQLEHRKEMNADLHGRMDKKLEAKDARFSEAEQQGRGGRESTALRVLSFAYARS